MQVPLATVTDVKLTATMHLKKAEALDSKGYLKNDIKQVKKMLNASPKMVRR